MIMGEIGADEQHDGMVHGAHRVDEAWYSVASHGMGV